MKKTGTKSQADFLESRLSHLSVPIPIKSKHPRPYVRAAYPYNKAFVVGKRALQTQTESFFVMKRAVSDYGKEVMDKEGTVSSTLEP
jgi:hypothetical protein